MVSFVPVKPPSTNLSLLQYPSHNGRHLITRTLPQLPLGLLNAAQGHQILVELKNGENVNGVLVNCDTWMNLILKGVIQTSPEGDRFQKMPELYVRGNNVRLPATFHDQTDSRD